MDKGVLLLILGVHSHRTIYCIYLLLISRGGDDRDAGADGVNRHDEEDAKYVLLGPREVVVVRVQEHVSARQSQGKHLSVRTRQKPRQSTRTSEPAMNESGRRGGGSLVVSGYVITINRDGYRVENQKEAPLCSKTKNRLRGSFRSAGFNRFTAKQFYWMIIP